MVNIRKTPIQNMHIHITYILSYSIYVPLKTLFTYSFEMAIGVNAPPAIIRVKSCPVREPKAAAYTHRSFVS